MIHNQCTWVDCTEASTHPQIGQTGQVWANLCLHHHAELNTAMSTSVPRMLSAWIKAQGGAKKASMRV